MRGVFDRRVLEDPSTARRDAERCCATGCKRATSDRKPYCEDHVMHMPYAQSVRMRARSAVKEAKAVAKALAERRAPQIDLAGPVADDVLSWLVYNAGSPAAVAREVDALRGLPPEQREGVAAAYAEALFRAGLLVRRVGAHRGSVFYTAAVNR